MTDPEQDEAFESYLKRRSVLPDALSSDGRLDPPAALDAIVLKKAREAIKAQAGPETGKQPMQRAPRWAVPVALAATIMLCLSIVMNISLNTNRPDPNLQRLTAARADGDRRESVPGDIPSREVILPEAKVAEAPAPHAPVVAEQGLGAPPGANTRMASAPSAAAPPPMPGARAAPAGEREQEPAYAESESASAPAADEPRVAARSAADKATMLKRRADASVRGDAAAGAGAETEASAIAGDRVAAAAADGPNAAGGGAVARGALQPANVGSQVAAAGGTQSAAADGTQVAAAGGAPAAAGDGPKHPADPKAWLRQIDALRAAGKNELADAEMGRFRAVFPGYAAKPAPPASSEPPK
jgi:hypothetical protein